MTQTATHPVTLSAIDALDNVHPKHVTRITARNAEITVGSIVRIEATQGTGSFYTGVRSGDVVVVTSRHDYATSGASLSVQHLDGNAAHLSVNTSMTLTVVHPGDWTPEMADAAKRAAEQGVQTRMEEALRDATGHGSYIAATPETRERALSRLDDAAEMKSYAFAVGIYREYMKEAERAERDAKFAAVRRAQNMAGMPC
jgi:hypothetical protein